MRSKLESFRRRGNGGGRGVWSLDLGTVGGNRCRRRGGDNGGRRNAAGRQWPATAPPPEGSAPPLLVREGHLTDGLEAVADGFALGHVNGPEHAQFQINGGISHVLLDGVGVWIHAATLPEAGAEPGWDCRVAAGLKGMAKKPCDDNSAKIEGRAGGLTQKWMLKTKLKIGRWTLAIRKHPPQMLHGLQQRVGLPARRR